MLSAHDIERPEPRWPAVIGVLAAVALHFALPADLRFGPQGMLAAVVVTLLAVAWVARHAGLHHVNAKAGYGVLAVLTAGLLYGVARLFAGLVQHTITAPDLSRAASVLWATNVIVFATWYWRLDGGGPNVREQGEAHTRGAFLFPQMAVASPGLEDATLAETEKWRPGFVDYLFVAFNTSTAFSPTDVPVLSRWAKLTMMLQSIISVTAVVLLVGRAVNIL